MGTVKLLVTRKSASVGIVIDEIHRDEIIKEVYPYLQVSEVENINESIWTIYSKLEDVLDTSRFHLYAKSSDGEPDNKMLLNLEGKDIIINQQEYKWRIKYVIRMLRNLLRWQLYGENYFYLHGGIVEIDNMGIAYLGKKKSGKTSSILSILSVAKGKYVTNDDITIQIDDSINTLGWPRAVGVRPDTIDVLKDFKGNSIKEIPVLNHPRHSGDDLISEKELDVKFLLPSEISNIFNCGVLSETKLKIIIFPRFVNKLEDTGLKPINRIDAIKYLTENLELRPDKHSDFLDDYFNIPSKENLCKKLEDIANRIPCYELHQVFEHIDVGAKLVRTLVEDLNSGTIKWELQQEG